MAQIGELIWNFPEPERRVVAYSGRNLERKALQKDLGASRNAALLLGAHFHSRESQTDTYFHVPHGRLKLREIDGQPAVLIAYSRPDEVGSRLSSYYLVPVPEPALLKAALTAALGVREVVRKQRDIYLWQNVRIHLDEVEGLGTFVEFEAVLGLGDDAATAEVRLEQLSRALALNPDDYLATSYADLLGF
jgi:adenylate cyclase class 2